MQGIAIPSHTMFTEDYIKESVVDDIVEPATVDGTFADLGISPQRIDVGLPIEHVRYYRVGGYDVVSHPPTPDFPLGRPPFHRRRPEAVHAAVWPCRIYLNEHVAKSRRKC